MMKVISPRVTCMMQGTREQGEDMAAPALGSILLGTNRPAELRQWYRETLAPEHAGEGPIDLGGFLLVIDGRDDVTPTNGEPGRMILNFHVDDFDAIQARLEAAGIAWIAAPEDRGPGRFATFCDLDGNYLQIIQFKERH